MKKVLTFLAFATALNVSAVKAYPPPQLLDDSASFRIAKSVKLGYGDASAPALNKGTKKADFNTCSSDDKCQAAQKCVNGKCEPVCTSSTCSGETPNCEAKDHTATCECSDTSCGSGKKCVDGKCETCTVGSKCNCSGEKVIDSAGKCVCPASVSCSAGQYVSDDCSCKSCMENDTSGSKCGCPGNTVPDGSGSCYCKTTKSCGEGFSFDSTNTCECVPCTDNASCDNPCPAGSFPNGSGCGTYVCITDENCAAGNRCENGGTESAECAPCGKNEQCRCPDGQLSDGSGKCVPVVCKTGLVCDSYTTEQCCDAGMQCVNPDTVESYCAACETDTQCTCPSGYVVDSSGKCVKPDCTKDSDCTDGNKCDNAGKSTASCTPCAEGETCTCTGGMIADGNGGCKFGCEFASEAECKAGTKNCSNCALSAGCYVCTGCGDGYQIDGSTCSPKACPTGYATDVPCDTSKGYKLETNGKSGDKACGKCVETACPSGYSTDTTSCGNGYKLETNGYSAGQVCGKCVETACPSGTSTAPTCSAGQKATDTSGYSGSAVCKQCVSCAAGATDCGCPSGKVADGSGGCKDADPCANVTCDGGKVCSAGVCGCPSGTVWYNNKCRKVGCPSSYNDHYDMLKVGSDCKLSPNGEVMQIGPDAYTLCASCTPYSCPTATTREDQLQNCKTTKSSGKYSGYMACVECTRCNTGYYLFMGKCLKCVNATCDGTDSATCNSGYENGHISNDATQYVCTKAENCTCTSATSGLLSSTIIVDSDNKVNLPKICTKMPSGSDGCSYQSIGTFIQLNSLNTSVTGVGDTRISSCSISSGTITCKHTHESGVSFKVKFSSLKDDISLVPGGSVSSCSGSQISCTFNGATACCPSSSKGCAEYADDCKSLGNGLYTHCRCLATSTVSSSFIN